MSATTRRTLLGTGAALLVAAPVAAKGPCSTRTLDTAFLALCAEYHRLHHEMTETPYVSDEWCDELADQRNEVLEEIVETVPTTAAGRAAKASVALSISIYAVDIRIGESWREQANTEQLIVIDALGAMAGEV